MTQFEESQISRLIQLVQKATAKNNQLQFVFDELKFDQEQKSQEISKLIIQNQQLITVSSQVKTNTNDISQQMTQLQPQYQLIFDQNQQLIKKIQRAQNQINLFEHKRTKSRKIINQQTKRKLGLAADCQQYIQKTQIIYQRIQKLKQEKRLLSQKQMEQKSVTQEIQKVLDQLRIIQKQKRIKCG